MPLPSQSATGEKIFGSGYFYGIPNAANPNPAAFGATQNISVDFKRDLKYLHGTNQLPIESASGKLTVSGKVEMATVNGRLINDLLLGTSIAAGQTKYVRNEAQDVPADTPYTVTIAPPGTGVFAKNLGVRYQSTNIPFVQVAVTPAAGQYMVNEETGVYTFGAADEGASLFIDYTYTETADGQTVNMTNQPMGKTGNFTALIATLFGTDQCNIQLNNCMSGGWSLATKLDDFAMPSFEYGAATDDNDSLGIMSFAQTN